MSDGAGAKSSPKPEGGDDKGDAATITIRVRDQVCVSACEVYHMIFSHRKSIAASAY